jgi:glycosyltransferase involved in cell wall biosynthesis
MPQRTSRAPTQLTVAVVVCVHSMDRLSQIRRCVASVLAGTRRPDELIVVVDNNPTLHSLLAEELGASVEVLPNRGSGASEARNTGLTATDCDTVAFIDDDAWADPGWLEHLGRAFDDPKVLGVGGRIEPDWEDRARVLPSELYWVVGATYAGHRVDPGPISRPIGANMAGRRELLLAEGGFPTQMGPRDGNKSSSNEELALFAGIIDHFGPDRVHYVPSAVVHHFAPAHRCSLRYLVGRSAVEGVSKADVRALHGAGVMGHDHSYVRSTLLPATGRYLWQAVSRLDPTALRSATTLLLALSVTASAYSYRLVGARARSLRRALRVTSLFRGLSGSPVAWRQR